MPTKQVLADGWRLQSSFLAGTDGAALSRPGAKISGWHETAAPRTVLCALVKDGTYPDPHLWPNPFLIPDSSDAFNEAHDLAKHSHLPDERNPWRDPWWYRTEVELSGFSPTPAREESAGPVAHDATPPDSDASIGQRVWLNLDCLNYRAEVWVNGAQVADREQLVGMFRRFRLDVTEQVVEGTNAIAILVYPVDHPGDPETQLEVYGPVRNFDTEHCNDVTEFMTVGYDCFPTVPDRNMA